MHATPGCRSPRADRGDPVVLGAAFVATLLVCGALDSLGSRGGPPGILRGRDQAVVDSALGELEARPGAAEAAHQAVRIADLPTEAVIRYVAPLGRNGPTGVRRAALQLLLAMHHPSARRALVQAALGTGCPDREELLEAAADQDRAGTLLHLLASLAPDEVFTRRLNSIRALGSLEAHEMVETLERLVRDGDEMPPLRRTALATLDGLLGDRFPALLLELLEDRDPRLCEKARADLETRFLDHEGVREALAARIVPSRRAEPVEELIHRFARRHRLDPHLIASVIEVESDFDPRALSRSGAQGLMQLMPETAAYLGVEDPFDPRQNIAGGTSYLRRMLDQFGEVPIALAAYNAGPGAVRRAGGIPRYPETERYIEKVLDAYQRRTGNEGPGWARVFRARF